MKKENGITLVSLILTVVVLIIIVSVSVSVGTNSLDSTRLKGFYMQLEIVQKRVDDITATNESYIDELYQKFREGASSIFSWLGMSDARAKNIYGDSQIGLKEINALKDEIKKKKHKISKWINYDNVFSRYTSTYDVRCYISSAW